MRLRVPSAFVVRRAIVPLGLTFGALLLAGCHRQRGAMRPVYAAPAGGTIITAPATAAPVIPAPADPTCTTPTTPGFADPGSSLSAPAISPPASQGVTPSGGGSDDPGLSPATPGVPPLNGPGAGGQASRRFEARPAARTAGRDGLRSRVAPYVNDPNDLFTPPRADRNWRFVVLHHSANTSGSYAQLDRDHRKNFGTAGCGYHFVIGNGTDSPDGQVEVTQRWSEQKAGAHCRNASDPTVNDYGIGICLIGNLDNAPPTKKQVESARALVAYLRDRYSIPATAVGTHGVIARTATACPGKHFPVDAILGRSDRGLALR